MANVYPGMCNMACPGDAKQGCGGSSAHTVFYAPTNTKPSGQFTSNLGCYADPPAGSPSLESFASYNFTSWSLMSSKLCLQGCADRGFSWGAIRASSQCFCGTQENFSLGAGNYISSSLCNDKCTGNASESCGFWNGATVFNVSASGYGLQSIAKPPGYLGKYFETKIDLP